MGYCGLRWGEVSALRLRHFDRQKRLLRVEETLTEVGGKLAADTPKSAASTRTVPMPEPVYKALIEHLQAALSGPDDYLFTTATGQPVGAVLVTADLPPFMNRGARIDVNVASMGDAASLLGGQLIMTPLSAADGRVHAVAQGSVAVSGSSTVGQAESFSQGVPTAGRIPNGATVELPNPNRPGDVGPLTLDLKNPDFATAVRIADAINGYSLKHWGVKTAHERDFRSVALALPERVGITRFIAEVGTLMVEPDSEARVIIDSRTGTIVIGQDVQVSTVAVTHGSLTVRVTETPVASQPAPFSGGKTVVLPRTDIDVHEPDGQLRIVGGTTLRHLVNGLNQIGLKPSGIIAILQAIKAAGALQAELITQ